MATVTAGTDKQRVAPRDGLRQAVAAVLRAVTRYHTSVLLLDDDVLAVLTQQNTLQVYRIVNDVAWAAKWEALWDAVARGAAQEVPALAVVCPAPAEAMEPAFAERLLPPSRPQPPPHGTRGGSSADSSVCAAQPACGSGRPYIPEAPAQEALLRALRGGWDVTAQRLQLGHFPVDVALGVDELRGRPIVYAVTPLRHVPRPHVANAAAKQQQQQQRMPEDHAQGRAGGGDGEHADTEKQKPGTANAEEDVRMARLVAGAADCYAIHLRGQPPSVPTALLRGAMARLPFSVVCAMFPPGSRMHAAAQDIGRALWVARLTEIRRRLRARGDMALVLQYLAPPEGPLESMREIVLPDAAWPADAWDTPDAPAPSKVQGTAGVRVD